MEKSRKGGLKVRLALLILAVLVAGFLRFWKISSLPYPPNGDEVAFGYYGWSILHFGTDEYGNHFPLNFLSIGDFKYPSLAYLNTVPAALFGLSDITTRFWDATSGVAFVLLIYFFAELIFSNTTVSIISAWLAALSPWSITESRLGYENHISMVLTLGGVFLLLKAVRFVKSKTLFKNEALKFVTDKNVLLFLSFLLFVISSFCYGAQRLFIPAFLFGLFLISFIKMSELTKARKLFFAFFLGITIIIFVASLSGYNRGRASEDLWSGLEPKEADRLQQLYVQAGTSPVKIPARLTWFFHNKYQVAVIDFLNRYLDHFSPNFLFFQGEASPERIPDMGVLLFIDILLLPVGLMFLLSDRKSRLSLVILAWLFLAPVPSALTAGGAHINRASLMIPALVLISGYGFFRIVTFFDKKRQWAPFLIISLGVIFSSLYTINQIFVQKPVDHPWFPETINREVVREVWIIKDNYKAVAMVNDDYIFFLFYNKLSPQEFIIESDITPISLANRWERINRLSNIYFKMPFNCPRSGKLDVLYVCSGNEVPHNSKIIKTFYYPDGIPAYNLLEFYPLSKMPKPLPALPANVHYMVEVEKNVKFPDGIIPTDFPSLW